MIKKLGGIFVVAFVFLIGIAFIKPTQASAAATFFVDDTCSPPGDGTPGDPFCTISEAVATASAGDTIRVAAGNYPELVNVNKTLNLFGASQQSVVGTAAGAFQLTADKITIQGFTIQGVTSGLGAGIHTTSANSGYNIQRNLIQNNSIGLYLNSNGTFKSNVGRNIFKNNDQPGAAGGTGIYSDQNLKKAEIERNNFSGNPNASILIGATPTTQNGDIDIERNVSSNSGAFLLFYKVDKGSVARNDINDVNGASAIFLAGGNKNLDISRNEINGGAESFSGIRIRGDQFFDTAPTVAIGPNEKLNISRNDIKNMGDFGIGFAPSAATGSGTIIERNSANNNLTDGIGVDTGNINMRFERNAMKNNTVWDARDDTTGTGTGGTANIWSRNACVKDSPPNICNVR